MLNSELMCLQDLSFEPLPHQAESAKRVINDMQGRALLADEVGLGKTIEAGLVVKELLARAQIKRVLVLCPASLAPQWCMEMKQKFGLYFYHNRKDHNWTYFDFIVASIDRAKRPEQLAAICAANFDLLIVDEAHRLKNNTTANFKAVKKINPRFLLLLTATPLQNNIKELYNLVELINPKLFGSLNKFEQEFLSEGQSITNIDELKQTLSCAMIRNNKHNLEFKLPPRRVELTPVVLSPVERMLYQSVNNYIKQEYQFRRETKNSILSLITLQREICSSSFAAQKTLTNMGLTDLAEIALRVTDNSKTKAVLDILREHESAKVIIFTEFKATQSHLYSVLSEAGIPCLCYNGDLKGWSRVITRHIFLEQDIRVLISTEAGGEGVNLQKANLVINYDLPWNPMRVEQRIGRAHRLGQEQEVKIFNLYAENTVEEVILALLRKKIDLFQNTIGQLDQIVDSDVSGDMDIMQYLHGEFAG